MPRTAPKLIEVFRRGEPVRIDAAIVDDAADELDFDRGDMICVRIGIEGYFQRFWVHRRLLRRPMLVEDSQ